MSRDASITLTWADSDYTFRLPWAQLEMLQEATEAGPWVVLERLAYKTCKVGDISHVLRCGLIGGGIEPAKAVTLVREYVEKRPPAENLLHAQAVLTIALHGAPEEEVGEGEAANPVEGDSLTTSPTES